VVFPCCIIILFGLAKENEILQLNWHLNDFVATRKMLIILKLMMSRMKRNEEEEDDGMLCNKPESPTQMERVFIIQRFQFRKDSS
jgi:hypothetical protein